MSDTTLITRDDAVDAVQIIMQLGAPEIERGREMYPHEVRISGEGLKEVQALRRRIVERSHGIALPDPTPEQIGGKP